MSIMVLYVIGLIQLKSNGKLRSTFWDNVNVIKQYVNNVYNIELKKTV